ncbi:Fur family peroxide stress response transcriptional regulator [Streptococcus saliviloxodontae]|uniref:Fur family peroxide stress response transcriptional regulator n=2 Tax=Streptococcus saliviloxodontae TaxID=1349416 RepID=A0ABS2PMM7_9STRE|nr:Fur family peroxide stress response transcriptional regulator [Streptococcus saliviloxodontae]
MEWSLDIQEGMQNTYNHVLLHLREKHIRITETRKAIIAYMINSHHHPSAEQIYKDLLPMYPNLSLATVYNNLKVLVKEGFVVEIKLTNDNTSYFDFMDSNHPHVVCEKCGKITDITVVPISDLKEEAEQQSGYQITKTQVLIYGVCPDCQEHRYYH